MRTLVQAFLFVTLVLILFGAFLFTQYKVMNNPGLEEIRNPIVQEEVNVRIEASNTVEIEAEDLKDAIIALGYTAAYQELPFMEIMKRAALGRLSEVFGKETLEFDIHFRILQLDSLSTKLFEELPESSKDFLQWYVTGINMYLTEHQTNLHPSFDFLEYQPEEWAPEDIILLQRFYQWHMNSGWKKLYLSSLINEKLKNEARSAFQQFPFIELSEGAPVSSYNFILMDRIWRVELAFENWLSGESRFYQGWGGVVTSRATSEPRTIMFDAPPISLAFATHLLHVKIILPETRVEGIAFPGVPGLVVGTNGAISWIINSEDMRSVKINNYTDTSVSKKNSGVQVVKTLRKIKVRSEEKLIVPITTLGVPNGLVLNKLSSDYDIDTLGVLQWDGWKPTNEWGLFKKLFSLSSGADLEELGRQAIRSQMEVMFCDRSGKVSWYAPDKPIMTAPSFKARKKAPSRSKLMSSLPKRSPLESDSISYSLFLPDCRGDDHTYEQMLAGDCYIMKQAFSNHLFEQMADTMKTDPSSLFFAANMLSMKELIQQWLPLLHLEKIGHQFPQSVDLVELLIAWDGLPESNSIATSVAIVWLYTVKYRFLHEFFPGIIDELEHLPSFSGRLFYSFMVDNKNVNKADRELEKLKIRLINDGFIDALKLLSEMVGEEIYLWEWKSFCDKALPPSSQSGTSILSRLAYFESMQYPGRIKRLPLKFTQMNPFLNSLPPYHHAFVIGTIIFPTSLSQPVEPGNSRNASKELMMKTGVYYLSSKPINTVKIHQDSNVLNIRMRP